MSAKFTPGPWIIDARGCVAKHWPEGGKATICVCPDGAEGQSNAVLMAAAPEMFEALEAALPVLEWAVYAAPSAVAIRTAKIARDAAAALAKARGEGK